MSFLFEESGFLNLKTIYYIKILYFQNVGVWS